MKTEELLKDCNDIARATAKKKIEEVTLESEEMLRLLNEKCLHLIKHFNEFPVATAIEFGIWARESLVNLYGPELFEKDD